MDFKDILIWIEGWDRVDKIVSFIALIGALISPAICRFRQRRAEYRVGIWSRFFYYILSPFVPFLLVGNFISKILIVALKYAMIQIISLLIIMVLLCIFTGSFYPGFFVMYNSLIISPILYIITYKTDKKKGKIIDTFYYNIVNASGIFLGWLLGCILIFGFVPPPETGNPEMTTFPRYENPCDALQDRTLIVSVAGCFQDQTSYLSKTLEVKVREIV